MKKRGPGSSGAAFNTPDSVSRTIAVAATTAIAAAITTARGRPARRSTLEEHFAREAHLALAVHVEHFHVDHVALFQDVGHALDTLVRDLGDVEEPVVAGVTSTNAPKSMIFFALPV